MNINKPKFWDKKIGVLSILFFPLSLIFILVIFFKRKFLSQRSLKFQLFALVIFMLVALAKRPLRFI